MKQFKNNEKLKLEIYLQALFNTFLLIKYHFSPLPAGVLSETSVTDS